VWAREVREASYEMEDVLDTFLVRLEGHEHADPSRLKHTTKKMGKVFIKAKARRDIAGAIEDIKKYLVGVAERHHMYKLDEIVSKHDDVSTSTIDPRLTAMDKEVTRLIGVDKSREKLISVLSPSHQDNDVLDKKIIKKVSIVGVEGLGKTTLAKAVYDKLSSEYECRAFVSVGRDHDLVTVLKDILFHLDEDKYHNIHTT
jgi:disease resistance protein RPM1